MKILVAEDEEITRFMLEQMLGDMGHEVVSAADGDQAWEALSGDPDLRMALLDWVMPGMCGVEIAERVKEDLSANGHYVYVIMISQKDSTADLVQAMEAGADDYLTKPVDLSELKVRIYSGLRLIELHDELRAARLHQEAINEELRVAHDELEDRVAVRTAELAESNHRLRLSEETFRAIFESAEDWMFVKDADLRFTHVNPAFLKSFNLERDQVIGRKFSECWNADEAESLEEVDSRVLSGNAIKHRYKTHIQEPPVVAEFVRVPLRDAAGQVIGLCGIGRESSESVWETLKPALEKRQPALEAYTSPAVRNTLEKMRLASRTTGTVLLLGESGVGKDFLARYMHEHSSRSSGPFIAMNCAALPTELAEAELFGHEAGAFTGAVGKRRGFLELAEGGTLLLNEVGELTLPVQAKLLTFLDSRTFTRVGGRTPMFVNAKVLAATNRNLRREVDEGRFRKDLLYRLDVFTVRVPPLRDRIEDLPVLIHEILIDLAREMGLTQPPRVEKPVMEALRRYHWPGNVRELKNILERAIILSQGAEIRLKHVETPTGADTRQQPPVLQFPENASEGLLLDEALDNLKRAFITEALQRSGNNVKEAAALLGIPRNSMYHYMRRLGMRE